MRKVKTIKPLTLGSRFLGKGEVVSSILTGSTMKTLAKFEE